MLCPTFDTDSLLSWGGATSVTPAGSEMRSPSPLGQALEDIEIAVAVACGTDGTIWYPPKEEDQLAPEPVLESAPKLGQQQELDNELLNAAHEGSPAATGDMVLIQRKERMPWQRAADKVKEAPRHAKFASGEVPYLFENQWDFSVSSPLSKADREATRRRKLAGLEVRELPQDHPIVRSVRAAQEQQLREALTSDGELAAALAALPPVREFGLFATRRFRQFDCLGEYCGTVLYSGPGSSSSSGKGGGRYVASFDQHGAAAEAEAGCSRFSRSFRDLAVDAGERGCDLRFINSFVNVAPIPNAAMRTAVVGRLPHVVVLCTQAQGIAEGEEVLLDYGPAYHASFGIAETTGTAGDGKEQVL